MTSGFVKIGLLARMQEWRDFLTRSDFTAPPIVGISPMDACYLRCQST